MIDDLRGSIRYTYSDNTADVSPFSDADVHFAKWESLEYPE